MDDYISFQSAELAAIYDAIYADRDDAGFWQAMAAAAGGGPILELGCGTGRVLLPLARAGFEITGLDLSAQMLERCRAKLQAEPPEVRDRVRLLARRHDVVRPRPALRGDHLPVRRVPAVAHGGAATRVSRPLPQPPAAARQARARHAQPRSGAAVPRPSDEPADGEATAQLVDWTDGRRIRWWMTVIGYDRSLQCNECEVTVRDHRSRRRDAAGSAKTLPLRYAFRYELEHLLFRAGFRVAHLYGDYDRSPFADESSAMIVAAEPRDA